ncbi:MULTISPECIES: adenylate/guanylate cyclase domain-containing protein [unclassified Bradyrhizobium]|uniref:adenylate/guanylate cyclase domain-containing protein n=1 Tax=unclassified Bradyrhizobium TaxID=2631580 RepID=UPI0020B2C7C5|nr:MULTISPECIES: adenylate/guanylate cyclase domain-containing protein [unclassified Bradyrhizobium]MCP3397531.1 adenylate/guanylate cyclase domain-containing protein [Bradyrhizobium sp. CCGB20]MCP3406034.1 adenylate/guanylate cyclase domain-containing protein [Bradyrhizobium sp. CCGB01]
MASERVKRRLAAVVAADVAGYSRLMHTDEEATHAKLAALLADGVAPAITEHGGRIVKNTGDGFLAEFPSAVEAVRAALQFQTRTRELTIGEVEDRRIAFRVGVNIGDVIVEPHDIFGDGVNIAARLESIAEPGGICVSSFAYDQVRGKVAAEFVDLGEQNLKNIDRPVRIYAAILKDGAVSAPSPEARKPLPLPDKPSIAVLPFENMLGDPEQEYFTDGMVEDIITALSRFKSLFVIARNSSFTFRGKAVEIKQVGRELGVRYVLKGSVRKAGGRVRIAGQLIEAATGAYLWADQFDGALEDIFALQDKVTSNVVAALEPRLVQAEIDRSERKPTECLDAVDLYYRALHAHRRVTRQGYEDALRLARQAISLDPNFAAAYALALDCYIGQEELGLITNDDVAAGGKQYALRAIEVGADDAFALARAANFFGRNLGEAGTAAVIVDQAIAVNPNLSIAWRMRGWISVYLGEHESAIEQFDYAMRLNPLDPDIYLVESGLAWANFLLRRFEVALSWATKALAHQKNYVPAIAVAMASYAMLGRIPEAQMMVTRRREAGFGWTISGSRKRIAKIFRQEDVELYIEACRIAGVPMR